MKYSLSKLEINGIKLYSEKNFIPEGTEERIAKDSIKKMIKEFILKQIGCLKTMNYFCHNFTIRKKRLTFFMIVID